MNDIQKNCQQLELNRLALPFMKLRQHDSFAYIKMTHSIDRDSQLIPVIAIPDGEQQWILIDGYLRVRALQKLGADTILAEVWSCDIATALLLLLAGGQQRQWEAIEQAKVLDVLHNELGLSQAEIAKRVARDVSWVNRRLALLTDLPTLVRQAHNQGQLSTWAVTRVIQPLARANEEHANQLALYLCKQPQTTRAIQEFFEHYQRSNQRMRIRMITEPALFFKSIQTKKSMQTANKLKKGPEGQWTHELGMVKNILQNTQKLITTIFYCNQDERNREHLLRQFQETQHAFSHFETLIREHTHAITANSSDHINITC